MERRIVLAPATRRKLKAEVRWAVDARYRTRCLIVLRADERWETRRIAAALNCSVSHVNRTIERFAGDGLCGLVDRREDNGTRKADEAYAARPCGGSYAGGRVTSGTAAPRGASGC